MNRELIANNPVWSTGTVVVTLNPGAAALTNESLVGHVQALWVANGGNAAHLQRAAAGMLVSANSAAVTIQTSGTTGVGVEIPANQSLYIPIIGDPDIRFDSTAAFGCAVFFSD